VAALAASTAPAAAAPVSAAAAAVLDIVIGSPGTPPAALEAPARKLV